MATLLRTVLALAGATTVTSIDNGLGLLPPMGWRSWNYFFGDINQTIMEQVMDAMASRSRMVDGKPTSLLDLGYNNCGLDDGWQKCGAGVYGSFHDAQGKPVVDTDKFPNMTAMTEHGHRLGLRVGWYVCSWLIQRAAGIRKLPRPPLLPPCGARLR